MTDVREEEDGTKKKRSRFGCNTCRARKVKCDERKPRCNNCERLQVECTGYQRQAGGSGDAVKRVRRRTYRSCNQCRVARCKCSGERPCTRCRDSDLSCSYETAAGAGAAVGAGATASVSAAAAADTSASRVGGAPATPDGTTDGGSSVRQPSVMSATGEYANSALAWLHSSQLPDAKQTRLLVNYYFDNFHPLRCFGFIHKPTFLRQMDENRGQGQQNDALLHIMCTLGAQFFALEQSDTVQTLPDDFILHAGRCWAKTAERLLLGNVSDISVGGLMAAQLLYDYALRMANFTQAFILSALMARMTQALQINLEYSSDMHADDASSLSPTIRESRRRLMYSCYVTDVLCSSGVEQLEIIHEKDIKIQLPCTEWHFLQRQSCITRTLAGPPLAFLPPGSIPNNATIDSNMGMLAYFVQQTALRRRVLRYIKHLDQAKLPWLPDSEFAALDEELRRWYENIPSNLEFTQSTIYTRKGSSQLGALCVFHCAYHQTMCDFYRIGTPSLYRLRSAFKFPPEQAEFQARLQWALFKSARTLAAIIAQAERHGPCMLGDSWLPTIAYDSNRIMLYYLAEVTRTTDVNAQLEVGVSRKDLVLGTIPYLQSNLKALKQMRATNVVAEALSRAAEAMLEKLGVSSNNGQILPLPNVILDDPYLALFNSRTVPGTPPQAAPDYVLNPLSIYRMARNEIPERHAPESTVSPAQSQDQSTPIGQGWPNGQLSEATNTAQLEEVPMSDDNQNMLHEQMYASMEGFGPNLDMFFAPDQDMDWLAADEAVVGTGLDEGILPWMGSSQIGDYQF